MNLIRLRPRSDAFYVWKDHTVLVCAGNGMIREQTEQGLFAYQTRVISHWEYRINGKKPIFAVASNINHATWRGFYIENAGREPLQQTLELRVHRRIFRGMEEEIVVTNYKQTTARVRLEIQVDADFADILQAKDGRQTGGRINRRWEANELKFSYDVTHNYNHQGNRGTARFSAGSVVRIARTNSAARYQNKRITFSFVLEPHQSWEARFEIVPVIDEIPLDPAQARHPGLMSETTKFAADSSHDLTPTVVEAIQQAKSDLLSMRLADLDEDDGGWVMAAGLPQYLGLYGRDVLTASWQAAMVDRRMMQGSLSALAKFQGKEINDWRDEQPGRMLHEARTGPLARLNYIPHARYYGSATTSGFYAFVLSELWHWTGNKDLVRRLIKPARKALQWLEDFADHDRDGFYEYQTRSTQGLENQGWKDSGDAIVYDDGSQVRAPIATCEEQAFVYVAKLHFSELLWWLDEKDEAKRLYREAEELKKRFNEKFWMDDERFIAMGLDSNKRQIRSVGSNPGHCVASGIVDESKVREVADRLFARDLFSGWGVRTLSSLHPGYNPYSYHRGSVWPVEQGTFAIGFMRYGLHDHAESLCKSMFEAASLFEFCRLPELFTGHSREDNPFPPLYPDACWPQAWSSSTIFALLQAMLGLYPYAPLNLLLVDPHLPEWLPEITLRDLHVGDATAALRFRRNKNGTSDYDILDATRNLHILRQPSPWSLTASFGERLRDLVTSL